MFELSTHIPNLDSLRRYDLSAYDGIYIGDYTCPRHPGNFSSDKEQLSEGVERVKASGKKCYLSLYAAPRNSDLPWIREVLSATKGLPLDGIEIHNLGLLRLVREVMGEIPIHLGVFGNLYTDETARILKGYGVERIFPNSELSLDEIVYLRDHTPIQVVVPLHGKIPLTISTNCFRLEHAVGEATSCEELCKKEYWFNRESWCLKGVGRAYLSGKDLCMIEHLPGLLRTGLRCFYIYSLGENEEYLATIGGVYREALSRVLAGERYSAGHYLSMVKALARIGMCNGYYFGMSGQAYLSPSVEGQEAQGIS